MAADVHEVDLRPVEEEVVVKRGHLEPGIEGRAHGRVHLVLEDHRVAHHDRAATSRSECGPGAEAHEWRHGPLVDDDLYVGPGLADLEDVPFGNQLAFESCRLLDGRGVEINPLRQRAVMTKAEC